jgi:sulfoxide reductase heme-binding subunit YedZ
LNSADARRYSHFMMWRRVRALLASKPVLWALLALPAAGLLFLYASGARWPDELTGPSGEWSARFLILALSLTPLAQLVPGSAAVRWLLARRRAFGVASFLYAVLHLGFYATDMGTLAAMLDELPLAGIWTGWAALLLMLPLALTSTDAAMRAMRRGWKRLQRLAYPAALLTLAHWIVVHNGWAEALLWFAPLAALQLVRLIRLIPASSQPKEKTA